MKWPRHRSRMLQLAWIFPEICDGLGDCTSFEGEWLVKNPEMLWNHNTHNPAGFCVGHPLYIAASMRSADTIESELWQSTPVIFSPAAPAYAQEGLQPR